MGLFDKIFSKKECDICGGDIGLLGNRKLEDGNLCKDCAKKLSPWFEERRQSTVEDIKKQLAYREANKERVNAFQVTREFEADSYHVYIDDNKGWFAVATGMSESINPDIVELSQVTSCKLHVDQNKTEEQYRDKEGNMKSYNPPRYNYTYNYSIKLGVNSPWFDDMDFRLNTFTIDDNDRMKMMEIENLGNQIVAALTGIAYNPNMNQQYGNMQPNGMYQQPMNQQYGNMQQNGMYQQPVNNMQYQQNNMQYQQPVNNMQYQQPVNNMQYQQPVNQQYGNMQQNNGMYNRPMIQCDKCGWVPEDPNTIPKFCPQCGDPINGNDMN